MKGVVVRDLLVRWVVTAVAVAVAVWLIPGMTIADGDWQSTTFTVLLVAAFIGLVNAFVKPIATFVSGCFIVITFGLFLLAINAAMLMLVSWLAGVFHVGFNVTGWVPALFGSIIISLVSGFLSGAFGVNKDS